MKPAAFDYKSARTLAEVGDWLAQANGGAKIVAGGQSLTPMLNLRLARPALLIDIKRIPALREIAGDDKTLSIGAGWTHAEIEDGAFEDPTRGLMRHVAGTIAYRAVRNRGTIGGSLAHADPAADWVSTMAALGAVIVAQTPDGAQRRTPAEAFMAGAFQTELGENDVLIAVEAPRLSAKARWGVHKICRKSGEFAQAIGVVAHDPARNISRVLMGATDGPPVLLLETAKRLASDGAQAAAKCVAEDIAATAPGMDDAKRALHTVAVRRALEQLSGRSAEQNHG